jgi:hypothetical protein
VIVLYTVCIFLSVGALVLFLAVQLLRDGAEDGPELILLIEYEVVGRVTVHYMHSINKKDGLKRNMWLTVDRQRRDTQNRTVDLDEL